MSEQQVIRPSDADYMMAARRLYNLDGAIEVEATAEVSRGDEDGAYVAAWVWVPIAQAEAEADAERAS